MMKNVIQIIMLLTFVNCSTTNSKFEQVLSQQEFLEDTIKEDKIIGQELPSWIKKSGIENGIVYTVGKAEFDVNKSKYYVQKAAIYES